MIDNIVTDLLIIFIYCIYFTNDIYFIFINEIQNIVPSTYEGYEMQLKAIKEI